MNRPDKVWNKLSVTEREIGGMPNSSEDIKQAHAAAIEMYINDHVGESQEKFGSMPFNDTLNDWAKFDINRRTKHLYTPKRDMEIKKINLSIAKYKNKGFNSKLIER